MRRARRRPWRKAATQSPGAVEAWRQQQRHVSLCRLLDRTLHRLGLILGSVRPQAERGAIDAASRHCGEMRWRRVLRFRVVAVAPALAAILVIAIARAALLEFIVVVIAPFA